MCEIQWKYMLHLHPANQPMTFHLTEALGTKGFIHQDTCVYFMGLPDISIYSNIFFALSTCPTGHKGHHSQKQTRNECWLHTVPDFSDCYTIFPCNKFVLRWSFLSHLLRLHSKKCFCSSLSIILWQCPFWPAFRLMEIIPWVKGGHWFAASWY